MTLHVYDELEQRSEAWYAARCGIVTASVVGKLITSGPPDAGTVGCPKCSAIPNTPCVSLTRKTPTPIKGFHDARTSKAADLPPMLSVADNETSRAVTATLVAERITGWTEDAPMTSDMWRGVECEPIARDLYSGHYEAATEIGFMVRDDWGFPIGYSPDGLVGDDGLLEIKSPRAKTHLLTVLADQVPAHNMAQLQTGLLVSGRKWIDYVSFCAGMPLFVKRVTPDPAWFDAITAAVRQFEATAAEMTAAYAKAVDGLPTTERIDLEIAI